MCTKKHFKTLAEALATLPEQMTKDDVINVIMIWAATTNQHFDTSAFLKDLFKAQAAHNLERSIGIGDRVRLLKSVNIYAKVGAEGVIISMMSNTDLVEVTFDSGEYYTHQSGIHSWYVRVTDLLKISPSTPETTE